MEVSCRGSTVVTQTGFAARSDARIGRRAVVDPTKVDRCTDLRRLFNRRRRA
jgi:hypothetical protein